MNTELSAQFAQQIRERSIDRIDDIEELRSLLKQSLGLLEGQLSSFREIACPPPPPIFKDGPPKDIAGSNTKTCGVCGVKIERVDGCDRVLFSFGKPGTRDRLHARVCRFNAKPGCINTDFQGATTEADHYGGLLGGGDR